MCFGSFAGLAYQQRNTALAASFPPYCGDEFGNKVTSEVDITVMDK